MTERREPQEHRASGPGRVFSAAERRALLGHRHRLAPSARADDPLQVARSLVAVHGTDPASVYVACWARTAGRGGPGGEDAVAAVDRELYEDRTLVRMLAMRRTVFVTPVENAPVLQAACTRAVAVRERRAALRHIVEGAEGAEGAEGPESAAGGDGAAGLGCSPAEAEKLLAAGEEEALRLLAELGEASTGELVAASRLLARQIVLAPGKKYQSRQNLAARVLPLLAADGRLVRARPRGSWTSHQHRWSLTERWLRGRAGGGAEELTEDQGRAELARAWLGAFGPGVPEDLQWWAGWTKTATRRALADAGAVEVGVEPADGAAAVPGVALPADAGSRTATDPGAWAALLPALDSTTMGWRQRGWYLDGHGPQVFDDVGNAGPTIWWCGRVVGGWAQDEAGEIRLHYLEEPGEPARAAVAEEARLLAGRLAGVRLTPRTRGRTPAEQAALRGGRGPAAQPGGGRRERQAP
jgi:hypothetical protein